MKNEFIIEIAGAIKFLKSINLTFVSYNFKIVACYSNSSLVGKHKKL